MYFILKHVSWIICNTISGTYQSHIFPVSFQGPSGFMRYIAMVCCELKDAVWFSCLKINVSILLLAEYSLHCWWGLFFCWWTSFKMLWGFRMPMWPLKHVALGRWVHFCVASSLFGLARLILPVAVVLKRVIVCPLSIVSQHVAYLRWHCSGWLGDIVGISWPCCWYWSCASLLSVSALFSPLLINLKFLPCSDAPLRNIPSILVFSPPPSRHIPYSPSDPLSYAPPYPISLSDPVTSISCYSCCVFPNHFHVKYTSSLVCINLLVQDDNWDGPLLVLRWVAVNLVEIGGVWGKGFWRTAYCMLPDFYALPCPQTGRCDSDWGDAENAAISSRSWFFGLLC